MVNIRGFPEINGENFPLDIWALYMQEVAKDLPVQQLDTPSPDLKLRIKTDGRASSEKPKTTSGTTPGRTTPGAVPGRLVPGLPQPPVEGQQQPPPPLYGEPQQPPSVYRPPPIYGPWEQSPVPEEPAF